MMLQISLTVNYDITKKKPKTPFWMQNKKDYYLLRGKSFAASPLRASGVLSVSGGI